MGDLVKIGARIAVMAGIVATIVGLFAGLTLPVADFSLLTGYVGKAKAILFYYAPIMRLVFPILLTAWGIELSIRIALGAISAVKWVLKILE